ncbi:TPA: hypothetical protein ACHFXW_004643, partial [Pseudomonas aeruginosa]
DLRGGVGHTRQSEPVIALDLIDFHANPLIQAPGNLEHRIAASLLGKLQQVAVRIPSAAIIIG